MMRAEWVERRRADWQWHCENFDSFPQVGVAFDGSPIRRLGDWGDGVMESDGYVCSPIAYSVRMKLKALDELNRNFYAMD